ncbi:MAG: 50S ribosomal protein L11 methyltransferase [Gammaproteobacteria bacterium]|nr:MAG: 50S ribosomal protein L11 methyltransferase [Gammaproteobacteria bacterium]
MNTPNNDQDWLEIQLETTEAYDSDALEEALFASGALSVTLTSKADEVILIEPTPGELPLWEQGIIVTGLYEQGFDINEALPILRACLNTQDLPLVGTQALAEREWALEWTKHFKPIAFGEKLWICPSHQSVPAEQITADTQIITLDPGLAFGTGTHPTTAMALTDIATHDIAGQHVIDFGCGSGVLGIAALKMGAKQALMVDIDPQALTTTRENARINTVDDRISCYLSDDVPAVKTDFLIANILLEPLLALEKTFAGLCRPQSRILLTGLLKEQVPAIINAYEADFQHFDVTESGDWAMVIAEKA